MKLKAASWVAVCATNGTASVGASLTLITLNAKSSNTLAPAVSVAVTRTLITPTSLFNGMPLKVPVARSKRSQPGRAAPLTWDASSVIESPASGSVKWLEFRTSVKALSSFAS